MGAKKVVVYAGIGLVWLAGFGVCYAVGQVTGNVTSKICTAATTKLLAL